MEKSLSPLLRLSLAALLVIGGMSAGSFSSSILQAEAASECCADKDFTVSITDHKSTVRAGDTLTYEITVRNNKNYEIDDVTLSDTLPAEVDFLSATEDGDRSGRTIVWRDGYFEAKESKTIEITVRVKSDTHDDRVLTNTATVEGSTVTDTTTVIGKSSSSSSSRSSSSRSSRSSSKSSRSSKSSSSSSRARHARIGITKEANTSEVLSDDGIRYTIYVENTGNTTLHDVTVEDDYPEHQLTIVNDDNADEHRNGRMVWHIGTLREGEAAEIRYGASLQTEVDSGETITNVAVVRTRENADDRDQVTVSVIGGLPQAGGIFLKPITGSSGSGSLPFLFLLTLAGSGVIVGGYLGKKYSV